MDRVAIATVLLLSLGCSRSPSGSPETTTAGERPRPGPIEPVCESGSAACRIGERLRFRADASKTPRWLAIFAERADESAPARTWFFPGPDGVALEIPPAPEPAVLPRSVQLGAQLRPGLYRLTILVFDHSPTPAEATGRASASLRLFRALELR